MTRKRHYYSGHKQNGYYWALCGYTTKSQDGSDITINEKLVTCLKCAAAANRLEDPDPYLVAKYAKESIK